jgi:hypothetical protein
MLKLYHGSDVTIDKIDLSKGHPQLVEALRYRDLNNQYYFGTEQAIAKLIKI